MIHATLPQSGPEYVIAETAYGNVRGIRENGIVIFRGVPYAGSVSGTRRFLAPEKPSPWTGVLDTFRLGPPAMQSPGNTYGVNEPQMNEDCLVLNIWTPAIDGSKRPVMVYNHGGSYTSGSAGALAQDGSTLAKNFDVVVVAANHRLGLFGFLYLDKIAEEQYAGSGNRGIQDIVAALSWVHENIKAFGGDPDNVMIFGESGGGKKTSCLYAMPAAQPFFHKASIESGPGVRMTSADIADETTHLVLKECGLGPDNWQKILDCASVDLIIVQKKVASLLGHGGRKRLPSLGSIGVGEFGPVVDGIVLPSHPFDPQAPLLSANKPLMVGWNEDEYTFFASIAKDFDAFQFNEENLQSRLVNLFGDDADTINSTYSTTNPSATPSERYIAIMSMIQTGIGSLLIAERKASQAAARVYLYNFGYKSEILVAGTEYPYGATHAMDIAYKFNNINKTPRGLRSFGRWSSNRPERFAASTNMASLWTSFARTGVPSLEDGPAWPAYTLDRRATMRIDHCCEVLYDRYKAERELWMTREARHKKI